MPVQSSPKSSSSDSDNGDSLLIASFKLKKPKSKLKSKSKSKSLFETTTLLKKNGNQSATTKVVGGKVLHKQSGNGDDTVKKLKRKRKSKTKARNREKAGLDEASRLQRRARYLLIKMKLEQNLIDAYSTEGWKGHSREKIKPEKELLRAKKEILKFKLGIRDAICQLDALSRVGCIEDSVIAPDGSVSHEHIFCAKCKSNEVSPDNDIVLCDGTCNCAFHQKCLDPPLDTESIPPGDQGWFCKFCECRMDIIEAMNAHLGTHFPVNGNWQDIFKEEAAFPNGESVLLNQEEEWPSDDSEDDDYDPERRENSISGVGTDDSSSSTSLGWSSDGEVFSMSGQGKMEGNNFGNHPIYSSSDSDETSDGEIMSGPRQRRAVDYKKLYDEMFGKDAPAHEQVSEDEDWGPGKRKRREKESDAASTLMTLHESERKIDEVETMEVKKKLPRDLQCRRSFFRIPPNAVLKLRKVFSENELPSRTVKENLSKELGLEPGKVSKWFKNARYLALKSRKAEGAEQLTNSNSKICGEPELDAMKNKTVNLAALMDTSAENGFCPLKNLKIRRKKPKSINCLKRRSSDVPLLKSDEVRMEHSDDMSLKRLLNVKAKRRKRRPNSVSTSSTLAAEAEMERLCRAKARLEVMKQKLQSLQSSKPKKSNRKYTDTDKELVIYVPIAELREKTQSLYNYF